MRCRCRYRSCCMLDCRQGSGPPLTHECALLTRLAWQVLPLPGEGVGARLGRGQLLSAASAAVPCAAACPLLSLLCPCMSLLSVRLSLLLISHTSGPFPPPRQARRQSLASPSAHTASLLPPSLPDPFGILHIRCKCACAPCSWRLPSSLPSLFQRQPGS